MSLQAKLKAKTKVARRRLRLLQDLTDCERLREAYRRASLATRRALAGKSKDLDPLVSEGLSRW